MQSQAAGQPPLARLPGEKAQPVAAAAAPGQGDSGQKEQGQVGSQGVNPGEEEASAWDIMRNLVKDKYKSNTDQTKQAQAQADSKKQKTISFQYDEVLYVCICVRECDGGGREWVCV